MIWRHIGEIKSLNEIKEAFVQSIRYTVLHRGYDRVLSF